MIQHPTFEHLAEGKHRLSVPLQAFRHGKSGEGSSDGLVVTARRLAVGRGVGQGRAGQRRAAGVTATAPAARPNELGGRVATLAPRLVLARLETELSPTQMTR